MRITQSSANCKHSKNDDDGSKTYGTALKSIHRLEGVHAFHLSKGRHLSVEIPLGYTLAVFLFKSDNHKFGLFSSNSKTQATDHFCFASAPSQKGTKCQETCSKIPRVSTFESLGLSCHAFSNFKQMQFVASAEPAHGLTELFSVQAVLSWHSHCTTQSTWIDNTGFRSIT